MRAFALQEDAYVLLIHKKHMPSVMNTTHSLINRNNRRFPKVVLGVLALLLGVGLAGGEATASAQGPDDPETSASPHWQANFDLQMARLLRHEPSLRISALQVVIEQAPKRGAMTLPQTTEALLDVIDHTSSQRTQLMVVQALSAIGPEHIGDKQYRDALSRLYAFAEKTSSERVRGAVADVISRSQSQAS